jgi:hypothetical protein
MPHFPEPVSRRFRWDQLTEFPHNPIFPKRLQAMERRGPGYNGAIVGTPTVADNSARAYPDFPEEENFLADGNHRYQLAGRHGRHGDEIICELHRGLTHEQMNRLRRGLNDRRTVKPAEVFLHHAEENRHGREHAIRDIVESLGWKISYDREDDGLPCTNELTWIYQQEGGRAALIQAITTYEEAWGRKNPAHSQARVIKGLGAFWLPAPQADRQRLVKAVGKTTADQLYKSGQRAKEDLAWVKTLDAGIRYTLVVLYNKQGRSAKLKLPA